MNKSLTFHELMVGKIRTTILSTRVYIYCELLSETVIPAGHDELLDAISDSWGAFGPQPHIEQAKANILDQKRLAEERAARKAEEEADIIHERLAHFRT